MPIDPSTAFVCYSHKDQGFALRLAKDLKAKGANVWMDKLDIRAGQSWDDQVEGAVDHCSAMIVILSPASVAAEKVKNEYMVALDRKKTVIPVMYQECKVPLQLNRLHYADFREDYAVGLDSLLLSLSISPHLPGEDEKPKPSRGPTMPDTVTTLVGHRQTVAKKEHRRGPNTLRAASSKQPSLHSAEPVNDLGKHVGGSELTSSYSLARLGGGCIAFLLSGFVSELLAAFFSGPDTQRRYFILAGLTGVITGVAYAFTFLRKYPVARFMSLLFGLLWAAGWAVFAHARLDLDAATLGGALAALPPLICAPRGVPGRIN